ncbi:hypothetical protein AAH979_10525 [Plantactinospora sp. ZYX-F-223]|uniref:hypothetical protein n=1 Tax=Plantactinospora sp. ZYX-F-223 TaxID=3144103 RepID=UPI0031FBD44B
MPTGPNSGEWGHSGATGWVTRWVLGTAIGQAVFTGTVRLVLAVLMGAALGGLAVWLVLRRRPTPQRSAAERVRPRFSPRADRPRRPAPEHVAVQRPVSGRQPAARVTVDGGRRRSHRSPGVAPVIGMGGRTPGP